LTNGFEKVILRDLSSAGSKNTDALVSLAEKSFPTYATNGYVIIEGEGFTTLASSMSMKEMLALLGNRPSMTTYLGLGKKLQCVYI